MEPTTIKELCETLIEFIEANIVECLNRKKAIQNIRNAEEWLSHCKYVDNPIAGKTIASGIIDNNEVEFELVEGQEVELIMEALPLSESLAPVLDSEGIEPPDLGFDNIVLTEKGKQVLEFIEENNIEPDENGVYNLDLNLDDDYDDRQYEGGDEETEEEYDEEELTGNVE